MIQIARFRIKNHDQIQDSKSQIPKEKQVWDYILKNYEQWKNENVKPLYLTNRGIYNDLSMVASVKSADSYADFILEHMSSIDCISDYWLFNLMEPRLFSIPKNLSQNYKRFTLTLKVVPREAPYIYEMLSKIKPTSEIIITYIAYTYHRHGDILISLLAGERIVVQEFTSKYIDGIKGVIRTEIVPLQKSKNLATSQEWNDCCGKYFVIKDTKESEDIDLVENWLGRGFE
jgi:hypothetical protein